ncbi:helix-turn-helix transcriptional regulator [Erysipelothrix anatis]|uniref:helix-turn-helix transcriptional regulator n=1 Tax=Erysipelothrix anatis TaxID=2683713 RepID=UPI001359F4BD|nr:helix-turn-helix transcriptional regulator [Erysipelothrix anatis]
MFATRIEHWSSFADNQSILFDVSKVKYSLFKSDNLDLCMQAYTMYFIVEGRQILNVNDDILRIRRGDVVLSKPGHQIDTLAQTQEIIAYSFNFSFLNNREYKQLDSVIMELFNNSINVLSLTKSLFKLIMSKIRSLFNKCKIIGKFYCVSIFFEILAQLREFTYYSSECPPSSSKNVLIADVKQYIAQQSSTNLSTQSIANYFSMSRSNMCKLFKKETGLSLINYLTRIRVQKACDLLIESDMSVLDISYEVGYQSISQFNKVFKNYVHDTPNSYRIKFKMHK